MHSLSYIDGTLAVAHVHVIEETGRRIDVSERSLNLDHHLESSVNVNLGCVRAGRIFFSE